MKKLLGILVLGLFLITPSWADDIRDFQIEGMSIGDSLLDYFSEEKIIKSKRRTFEHKSFYIASIADSKFITYESIDFYLKTNDKKYKIYAINALIFYRDRIKECTKKKAEILIELEKSLDKKFIDTGTFPHTLDESGLSKQIQSVYEFSSGANVRVECYDWTNKMKKKFNVEDNLSIGILSREIQYWIDNGYQ